MSVMSAVVAVATKCSYAACAYKRSNFPAEAKSLSEMFIFWPQSASSPVCGSRIAVQTGFPRRVESIEL